MKRYLAVILLIICALNASAQSALTFTPAEWDFGTIAESGGRVSHTFTGVNTSGKPVVILEIFSSCGCTVPEYSKKPILPGEKTQVKVTYDPMNRPGVFMKDLAVYDTERRRLAKLTIRGSVTPRVKTAEELYPVEVAGGLRMTESMATFSYLYHGRPAMSAVGILNTSGRALRLELIPAERSGFLTLDYPRELAAGAQGEIRIGYTIPADAACYGTVKDVLIPRVDGRESSVRLMAHGMAVDNPARSNEIYLPKAEIDKYILKFDVLKRGGGLRKMPVTISNTGDGVLFIRAVEMDKGIGCTLRTERSIAPGRSVTAYVTVDPSMQEYGPLSGYLTVVTNDPDRPMRRVRVTAIIEE